MLTRIERACLTDLRGVAADSYARLRGGVVAPGDRPGPGRAEGPLPPARGAAPPAEAVGPDEAGRRAFWLAYEAFVRDGRLPTARHVSAWLRRLAALHLPELTVEARDALGWEARVLIWIRHQRQGRDCPWRRQCGRMGPRGDCLAPVSLPVLLEIQRAIRRLPGEAGSRAEPNA
ncbi:MAG: hypothetical protein ACE147_07755 [Candidatus Methylomirabilales bacterium]